MDELISKLPKTCIDLLPEMAKFFEGAADHKPQKWKGHFCAGLFPPETIKLAHEKWSPKDDDVLVASYPKTGTTWTHEIVRLIMFMNDPDLERLSRAVPMPLTYIENGPPCTLEIMDHLPLPRRILISHLPAQVLRIDEYLKRDIKVIYVTRNPRDEAVSLFNFFQKVPYAGEANFCKVVGKDWNTFFDNFIQGRIPTQVLEGEFYPYHILSWLPYRNHPKVLFLRYEEMKKDPVANVKKIASFIGCELSEDDAVKVAQRTSFKSMKGAIESGQFADSKLLAEVQMFRKGEIGDWKNYFTAEQIQKMDEIFQVKLKGTGITFEYE